MTHLLNASDWICVLTPAKVEPMHVTQPHAIAVRVFVDRSVPGIDVGLSVFKVLLFHLGKDEWLSLVCFPDNSEPVFWDVNSGAFLSLLNVAEVSIVRYARALRTYGQGPRKCHRDGVQNKGR